MRLSKIKMAGFKSFVDPTNLIFPSSRVGIVGPNGCGKSNIIDAVRWVMGESSKHIRGNTLEDVIFNGSSGRKPVGQGSVELVFDNTKKKLGGKYAAYDEISIRRQVTREGQSKYFLNGTHCRRRDIVDIFLGTGLGPRSYAIIEQGMISRLIDAKPEELRTYIEEAAGISKYKERRRETENRMRHTRENLDRLNDLIDEVDKQITRLKRQATIAEKYKTYKEEERRAKAELLLLRWQDLQRRLVEERARVEKDETELEKMIAELRASEAEIEKLRQEQTEANEQFNKVQSTFYEVGAEISRFEQSIKHAREQREQRSQELEEANQALSENQQELTQQEQIRQQQEKQIEDLEPQLEAMGQTLIAAEDALTAAEHEVSAWQQSWDDLMLDMSEPAQQAQVHSGHLQHLDTELSRLQDRQGKLAEEHRALMQQELDTDLSDTERQLQKSAAQMEESKLLLDEISASISGHRQEVSEAAEALDAGRTEAQTLKAELASLEALQEAALQGGKVNQGWLNQQGLANAPKLADQIQVENGWERAVETILEGYLEAVCTDQLDRLGEDVAQLDEGRITLFDVSTSVGEARAVTLASKVQSDLPVHGLLAQVYIAPSVSHALQMRSRLAAHESVITPEGIWLSKSWLRYSKADSAQNGVLERKARIEMLKERLEEVEQRLLSLQTKHEESKETLSEKESAREEATLEHNRAFQAHAELQAEAKRHQGAVEHWQQRQSQLKDFLDDAINQLAGYETQRESAQRERDKAEEVLRSLQTRRSELQARKEQVIDARSDCKEAVEQARSEQHKTQISLETVRTQLLSAQQVVERIEGQNQELNTRVQQLQAMLAASDEPIVMTEEQLKTALTRRSEVEEKLNGSRAHLQDIEDRIRQQDEMRLSTDNRINEQREKLNQLRMQWQELNVRGQTLKEQSAEYTWSFEELEAALPEEANVESWEQTVSTLETKISRLGSINLAAIDEFKEQSERKEYLDNQHADLTQALETLESAIKKIDRETKERFRDTFERINSTLQNMYPRLFPGGKAYLEMTDDDLLTAGVTIMARPPGKRISSIHLLSGGEKALTAVALVLSIFELNPAPFCLLDEVDAPLDEANVGRFCELIKDMSERVQFIFITHNKTTMEYANHLMGVTMNEPGVSRLVSVDIEEAAELATA